MQLHRIEIAIRPENAKSLRVVEKLSFRPEGLRPRYLHIDGDWRDHLVFALNAEEVPEGLLRRWESVQPAQSGLIGTDVADTPLRFTGAQIAVQRRPYGLGCGDDRCDLCGDRDRLAGLSGSPFRRHRADEPELTSRDPADRFSESMHIVRHGTAPLLDQDLAESPSPRCPPR